MNCYRSEPFVRGRRSRGFGGNHLETKSRKKKKKVYQKQLLIYLSFFFLLSFIYIVAVEFLYIFYIAYFLCLLFPFYRFILTCFSRLICFFCYSCDCCCCLKFHVYLSFSRLDSSFFLYFSLQDVDFYILLKICKLGEEVPCNKRVDFLALSRIELQYHRTWRFIVWSKKTEKKTPSYYAQVYKI